MADRSGDLAECTGRLTARAFALVSVTCAALALVACTGGQPDRARDAAAVDDGARPRPERDAAPVGDGGAPEQSPRDGGRAADGGPPEQPVLMLAFEPIALPGDVQTLTDFAFVPGSDGELLALEK